MKISDLLKPWQKDFLKTIDENRFTIAMVARSQGKSFCLCYSAVQYAILRGWTIVIVSTAERQSTEFLKQCVAIVKYCYKFLTGTQLAFDYQNNSTEIRFSTGGRILALPSNPDTIRGIHCHMLCIDECAFIPDAKTLWQAVAPMVTSPTMKDTKVVVISTPAGQSGLFYDLWSKENDFTKFKRTIYDVGLTEQQIADIRKTCVDSDVFATEFCCEFMDSNSTLFSYELLRSCVWESIPKTKSCCLGIDLGRTHDKTSIAVLLEGEQNYIDHVETMQNREFDYQFKYISKIIDSLHPRRVSIDAGGLGMNLAENLRKKYGGIIDAVQFTNQSKNEMFSETKRQFGLHTLLIPNDDLIIQDLHQIKRIVSPNGNLSFTAGRDENGHADIATSIALAIRASMKKSSFMPFSV